MLTLQFVPYTDIEDLSSEQRVKKLIGIVKGENIVLMQGRLNPDEETLLIQKTMEEIDKVFKGIEICTIYPEDKNLQVFKKLSRGMLKFFLGHREGLTIIGPATIVKEIKRDPNKIQLLTLDLPKKKRKKK